MGTIQNPSAERMGRADLEQEVRELRVVAARCNTLEQRAADQARRIHNLEQRDAERAKQLAQVNASLRTANREADNERHLRREAEANAKRFHAQALKARADLLKQRTA